MWEWAGQVVLWGITVGAFVVAWVIGRRGPDWVTADLQKFLAERQTDVHQADEHRHG